MRSFDQLRDLKSAGIRRLVEAVFDRHGAHFIKLALSETAPSLREYVFESMSDEQRRTVIGSRIPEGLSHDDLPGARWQIMELAAQLESGGELVF